MIGLGCDHGGFALMEVVRGHLEERGAAIQEFGTFSEESCDYPEFAAAVARSVADGECEFGILICGTGVGMSIAANKVRGARAALCGDCFSAEMTRRHNDANILCLGARVVGEGLALRLVDTFLAAEFEGGRHARRVAQLKGLEEA
ncbi:MAG: ribose 5-phosphate isomerase B [Oscillospiraceae bacterium]|jgi:ribose 5-phosphate isomerase B|nr:ribose 5-phosphate isomerase B [Oscillospiraceae bacterium]